ncbi:accessory gene regulator ArgB-like protein [Paenibacillus donghaensis]|uniref:Accessory regulator AgrB n=1 Tax=Paenibacillus donghaensis TaxID=414771 RepID=A0A2Z2K7C4_9BACL|nr:accessory gene regulator B family protein [Paenibacillus donghaensis]ASA20894.1 accessory regulator AgrB [Paenibacillus donghaensis]
MIEKWSACTAQAIKRIVPHHPASEAVLKYALEGVYNALLIIVGTLLISAFTGRTAEAVTILISFALLRQISGGKHLKSGVGCVIFTTAAFTLLSWIRPDMGLTQILNVISLLLVSKYAPSRIEQQSRIPRAYYPVLKIMAALLIGINFVVASPVIAVSFFAQALTLIHFPRREVI